MQVVKAFIRSNIPNLITCINFTVGFAAILSTFNGNYDSSAYLILWCMVLDGVDGGMARLLGVISPMGQQLDSLVDVVVFGVAPALLMYGFVLNQYGIWGAILCASFPIAGALRLARFNVEGAVHFYSGQPITIAAATLATVVLGAPDNAHIHVAILPLLAVLMVSPIPYPRKLRIFPHRVLNLVAFWGLMLAILACTIAQYRLFLFLLAVGYNLLILCIAIGKTLNFDFVTMRRRVSSE